MPDGVTLSQVPRASRFARWKRKWMDAATPVNNDDGLVGTHTLQEMAIADERSPHQPWQRALQACSRMLAELPAGSQLTVVVSNQWLRYQLLPAMPPMQSHSASLAVARALFMETYGEVAATWHMALEPLPQGEHQFACAIDPALLDAIATMATQSGCRLVSVQPAMMHLYNRLCRQLGSDLCGVVQVEAGRIHLALMCNGGWLGLSACASHAQDWPQHLLALLQRETMLLGDGPLLPGKLFVHIALASVDYAAWPALQATLAEIGWQAMPVFSHEPGHASDHETSIRKQLAPTEAWEGG